MNNAVKIYVWAYFGIFYIFLFPGYLHLIGFLNQLSGVQIFYFHNQNDIKIIFIP